MLVLTRKTGESLLLGDEIEIRIVRIDGDHVRIGISAPRSIAIVRGELVEEIERETSAAAGGTDRSAVESLSRRLLKKTPQAPGTPEKAPPDEASPANDAAGSR